MTCELISTELNDEKKGQILGILSVGCDRQTAANFIGCSLADIRHAMQCDESFAASVCRAEAGAELNHMRNVQEAAKDQRNWRASVWWLERRAPERFGPRGPGVVTARQLKAFVEILAEVIRDNIRDEDERRQILGRLNSIAASVDRMLYDLELNLANAHNFAELDAQSDVFGESGKSYLDDGDNSDEFTA